jgi:hypothetical protein
MQKFLTKSLLAGSILLALNFIGLYITMFLFPSIAEQYFSPTFDMSGYKGILFLFHPFVLSFALAWFWLRFKDQLSGSIWVKGVELGLVYGAIAVLPSMWMILSAFDVTPALVITWFIHGVLQGTIVGIIYAKINP